LQKKSFISVNEINVFTNRNLMASQEHNGYAAEIAGLASDASGTTKFSAQTAQA
jgi:hypothetical protein